MLYLLWQKHYIRNNQLIINSETSVINIQYRDKSNGNNTIKNCNINSNSSITNLELAFLRAYNAFIIINNSLKQYSSIIKKQNIEIIAIDEHSQTGYNWRKITIELTVENFYLDDFNALPSHV